MQFGRILLDAVSIPPVDEQFGEGAAINQDLTAWNRLLATTQAIDADAGHIEVLSICGLVEANKSAVSRASNFGSLAWITMKKRSSVTRAKRRTRSSG